MIQMYALDFLSSGADRHWKDSVTTLELVSLEGTVVYIQKVGSNFVPIQSSSDNPACPLTCT